MDITPLSSVCRPPDSVDFPILCPGMGVQDLRSEVDGTDLKTLLELLGGGGNREVGQRLPLLSRNENLPRRI